MKAGDTLAPAGTVTEGGGITPGSLLERETMTPPVGARAIEAHCVRRGRQAPDDSSRRRRHRQKRDRINGQGVGLVDAIVAGL